MERPWSYLGCAWAAPVTLVGLAYALAGSALGWYRWVGAREEALVWALRPDAPAWVLARWRWRLGRAVGQVVVLKHELGTDRGNMLFTHELEHVHQCMKLGALYPVAYCTIWLCIRLCCESADPTLDHSFEVSARRRAGQVVDVADALQRRRRAARRER